MPPKKLVFTASSDDPGTTKLFNDLIDSTTGVYGQLYDDAQGNTWWSRVWTDKSKAKWWILQYKTKDTSGNSYWKTMLAIDINGNLKLAGVLSSSQDLKAAGLEPQ